jgi:glycosyltransferase 2 family protein
VFRSVPLDGVVDELARSDPYLVILAWGLFLWSLYVAAATFRLLMERHEMKLSTGQIFEINLATQFYSLFLPGSVSSFIRWYKFARCARRPAEALAVVVSSRIAYTLALALVGLLCAIVDPHLDLTAVPTATLSAVLAVAAGVYLLSFSRVTFRQARRLVRRSVFLPSFLRQRLEKMLAVVEQGQGLPAWVHANLVGLSVLRNLMVLLQAYVLALAFGLSLSIATIGWVWSFTAILVMLPVSFAGLGVREASLIVLLAPFGVAETSAVGLSLLWLSSLLIAAVLGGALEGRGLLLMLRRGPHMPRMGEKVGQDRSTT